MEEEKKVKKTEEVDAKILLKLFHKYEEIDNYFSQPALKYIRENESDALWVGTEKIHGTNFSFICNGQSVLCGKRTSILKKTDQFYHHLKMSTRYEQNILNLFVLMQELIPTLKLVRVFGEYYGGNYEHPDVPKTEKPIQKGIFYSPNLEFEAFDIFVEYVDEESETLELIRKYYPYKKAIELFKEARIPYAEILYEGTLSCVLEEIKTANIDNFESRIYLKHDLPKIENNIAEGIVIKENEAKSNTNPRTSLKIKSLKFMEKSQIAEMKCTVPEEEKEMICDRATSYITENRLDNVVSKLKKNQKQRKKIQTMLVNDAWKDFCKEESEDIVSKAKEFKSIIFFKLNEKAYPLIAQFK
jgi:Rnl2 family RNA ligase